jgi:hypothetical protein
LFSNDLFPLALGEIKKQSGKVVYAIRDDVASTDYAIPKLKILKLQVD